MTSRKKIAFFWTCLISLSLIGADPAPPTAQKVPEQKTSPNHLIVSFSSAGRNLPGYLFKPSSPGPFPAMIFHHGHHKGLFVAGTVPDFQALAKYYTSHGYILFLPDRHPQAIDPSEFSEQLRGDLANQPNDPEVKTRQMLESWNIINRDVEAAVHWLKEQSDVDKDRILMSGVFSGAVQTLFSAEKDLGVRACVVFSPAATTWNNTPVLQALLRHTVRTSTAPIFLINPRNDHSLEPAEILRKEIERKGGLNRAKIYPPFGKAEEHGKMFAIQGADIWGPDVMEFLKEAMPKQRVSAP